MSDFLRFRFLIPPIISIISAFLLIPRENLKSIIDYFYNFFGEANNPNGFLGFLGGSAIILALGFIISNISNFFVVRSGWNVTEFNMIHINDDIREYNFKEVYVWAHLVGKNAYGNKYDLDKRTHEYIEEKLSKRWEMFLISFNSFVGVFLVLLLLFAFFIHSFHYIYYLFLSLGCFVIETSVIFLYSLQIKVVIVLSILFFFYFNFNLTRKSHEFLKLIMLVFDRDADIANKSYEEFKKSVSDKLEKL